MQGTRGGASEGGPLSAPRDRATGARARLLVGIAAAACLATACAGASPRRSTGGVVPSDHPRAALLPFENLGGREAEGSLFSKVFFAELVASDALEMVEPGRVDEVLDSLAIRSSAGLTPAQLQTLGDSLHAPYLLLGSVLESGKVESGSGGSVPSVGATLRLVEAKSGRVLWAGVHFRDGGDHETVFGWGREPSAERLVLSLAKEMLSDFHEAGARYARRIRTEGTR